jgi:hypothetical protein
MFARGVVYLDAAHLPVPKSSAAKSSVSVSSKLIEIKGLQILHFGHLRKTGGGVTGWYTPRPFSVENLPQLNPIILDIRQRMSTLSPPKGSSLTLPFRLAGTEQFRSNLRTIPLTPIILGIRQRMSTLSPPKGSSLVLPFRWLGLIPFSQDPPVVPLTPIILDIRQRMSTLSLPKGSSLVLPFRWLSSIPLSQGPPVIPATPIFPTLAHPLYNPLVLLNFHRRRGRVVWS